MVKYFCDSCGKETEKNYVTNSAEFQGPRVRIVLTVSLDGKFSGEMCRQCLFEALEAQVH